ncbi:hypothetical protein LTR36_000266 [Oleoguttula mirabilis]|uniref:Uncharacterized protein n=1 Tax=Oleoguttula mirabilis TaxID=1507867 RepID=A0AAV9K040_9PEZI|nr:hypothetical protein LTR36_000266 [Oleoguttula mirabilis]
MAPYVPPPALPGTALPRPLSDCDDRALQGTRIGGAKPDGHETYQYPNQCSSAANSPPFPFGPPGAPGLVYYMQTNCPGLPGAAHAVPHTSCGYCRNSTNATPWITQAAARMLDPPPSKETKTWRGFWTRLCSDCQVAEQLLIDARTRLGAVPAFPPTAAQQALMENYPLNTCTCLPKIRRHFLCVTHAEQQWVQMKSQPAAGVAPAPSQLVAIRNRNMAWLRTIKNDPTNGNLTSTAHGSRRALRSIHSTYRACRCGKEVVRHVDARVFQCTVCEGVIWQRNVTLPAGFPTPAQQANHSQGAHPLNRVISPNLVP